MGLPSISYQEAAEQWFNTELLLLLMCLQTVQLQRDPGSHQLHQIDFKTRSNN